MYSVYCQNREKASLSGLERLWSDYGREEAGIPSLHHRSTNGFEHANGPPSRRMTR